MSGMFIDNQLTRLMRELHSPIALKPGGCISNPPCGQNCTVSMHHIFDTLPYENLDRHVAVHKLVE